MVSIARRSSAPRLGRERPLDERVERAPQRVEPPGERPGRARRSGFDRRAAGPGHDEVAEDAHRLRPGRLERLERRRRVTHRASTPARRSRHAARRLTRPSRSKTPSDTWTSGPMPEREQHGARARSCRRAGTRRRGPSARPSSAPAGSTSRSDGGARSSARRAGPAQGRPRGRARTRSRSSTTPPTTSSELGRHAGRRRAAWPAPTFVDEPMSTTLSSVPMPGRSPSGSHSARIGRPSAMLIVPSGTPEMVAQPLVERLPRTQARVRTGP